ncbi:ABC transporter substrate-binding protein [Burkholderia cenocepacia]
MARTDSGLLPTPESLKGKRVGVLQASIQETYAKAHWEPAGVSVVAYQDQNQAYADLVSGRLDATLVLARPASAASCRVRTAKASRSSVSPCATTGSSAAASRSGCARATTR